MERTLVNSGDLYQLSEELDWQVCRVPRIPNFKPVKKRSFRLSWGSSTLDPDFCMYLEEDDETRYRAESYNLGQFRLSMSWNKLILKYRNRTIDELLVVFMDSATFMTVTPSLGSISPMSNSDMLTFQYYLADSLDFAVEKLILNMKRSSITPNYNQQSKLLKRIVIFKNYNQIKQIKSVLQKQDEYIKGKCAPTKEQLELCRGALSMDFGKDTPEMNQGHIEVMCEEANVSQFINNYLQSEIINNKRSR